MSSSEEFSDTSSEEYLSDDSECLDFEEIACTMSFSYVTLHIWTHLAKWGTNANDR